MRRNLILLISFLTITSYTHIFSQESVEKCLPENLSDDLYSPGRGVKTQKEVKKVLAISSFGPLYRWSNNILESINNNLTRLSRGKTEISIEHLSVEDFRNPNVWLHRFNDIIDEHIRNDKPDLLVLVADEAWMCYRASDNENIKDLPVVLVAVKPLSLSLETYMEHRDFEAHDFVPTEQIRDKNKVTGILQGVNIEKDIDLITSVTPDINSLAVISNIRFFGLYSKHKAREYIASKYPNYAVHFYDSRFVTTDSLFTEIEKFSPQTGILFAHWVTNEFTNNYYETYIYPEIAQMAKVPIVNTSYIRNAHEYFLGGYYSDASVWGISVAQIIHKIIDGVPVNQIEMVELNADNPVVYWKAIQKFNLSEEQFPENTIYENRPIPLYMAYSKEIIFISIILIIIGTSLVVSLFLNFKLINARKIIQKQADDLSITIAGRDKMYNLIAHDLRSPLSSIKMILDYLSDSLKKEDIGEERLEMLVGAQNITSDMFILLDNLLKWTKQQLGRLKIAKTTIDIASNVEGLVELYNVMFQSKGIQISINSPKYLEVVTDADVVKTIVRNLLSNACKFSYEGGKVEVTIDETANHFTVEVKDYGCGISEDNLKKILARKEQLTTLGTSNEEGSGLGLSLCIEFSKLLGGEFEIKSTLGKGTTCRVNLPK